MILDLILIQTYTRLLDSYSPYNLKIISESLSSKENQDFISLT